MIKIKPKVCSPMSPLILTDVRGDSQMRVMSYDSVGNIYTDVINDLKMNVDFPVCTYWRYARLMEESVPPLKAENGKE